MDSNDVVGGDERHDELKRPIETAEDEVALYTRPYTRSNAQDVRAAWPKVESVLQQYGITCELDQPELFMNFLVPRGTDPDAVSKARMLLHLLSYKVPAAQALRAMDGAPCDIIYTGYAPFALAKQHGIELDKYRRRKKLLMTLPCEELAPLLGCDVYLRLNYDLVAAIGHAAAGLRVLRKIVIECIVHNVPPAPLIRNFKAYHAYRQASRGISKLALGMDNDTSSLGISNSASVREVDSVSES